MAPRDKFMTADEAAALINNNDTIGFSGFTPAGRLNGKRFFFGARCGRF